MGVWARARSQRGELALLRGVVVTYSGLSPASDKDAFLFVEKGALDSPVLLSGRRLTCQIEAHAAQREAALLASEAQTAAETEGGGGEEGTRFDPTALLP